MAFLNAIATAAIVYWVLTFLYAWYVNVKIGARVAEVKFPVTACGVIGVLWLVFG